jgi:hypothetical protein
MRLGASPPTSPSRRSCCGPKPWPKAYSITLSARTNNASGTVTPIALAVLRLNQLELGRLFDGDVGWLDATEKLDLQSDNNVWELIERRPVGGKAAPYPIRAIDTWLASVAPRPGP